MTRLRGKLWGQTTPVRDQALGSRGPSSNPFQYQGGGKIIEAYCDEPMAMVVTVQPVKTDQLQGANPGALGYDPAYLIARVTWGSEGVEQSIEVDVGSGVSVPVFGTRVTCTIETQALVLAGAAARVMPRVTGSVAPGAGRSMSFPGQLTRSVYLGTLAALASSIAVQVPPFARALMHSYNQIIQARQIEFRPLLSTAIIRKWVFSNSASLMVPPASGWLPTDPDCGMVVVTNLDAVNSMQDLILVFGLAL